MEVLITIKDSILRSYLGGLFERRDDGYAVNTDTITGAVICSLVSAADYPRMEVSDATSVRFYLPHSRYTDSMRNRYLYVTREAEAKINLVLRKEFDVNFTSFLTESRIQGFRLKDIISIFIVKNNMDIFDGDIETLKKRYYRKEIQDLKNLEKKLRQKAYSISKLARRTVTDNIIIRLLTF